MPSSYTTNIGLEKPGVGEQTDAWGPTANTNFDLMDQAISGAATVTLASAGTSGSPNTLAITNATLSDGRNRSIEFNDGGDLGATAYVQLTPNTVSKICHIRNSLSGSQALVLFQGTYDAGRALTVPAGRDMEVMFDGGGATAVTSATMPNGYYPTVDTPSLKLSGTAISVTATEINRLSGVTSNVQTQINAKQATITGAATTIVSSDLTASRALVSNGSGKVGVSAVTATELGYLDGVTSNIQTQLNSAGTEITGAATSIVSSDLTANRALISNSSGKVAISAVTSTELGYLDGVTSAIQTQINSKAASANPIFSGTVTLPGNWTMVVNGGHLEFRYNGTAVFEIQNDGDTLQSGHADWNGTP